MVDWVVDAVVAAGATDVKAIVSSHHAEVAAHLDGRTEVIYQREAEGTGHAVLQVPAEVLSRGDVLVVNADSPLLTAESIRKVIDTHRSSGAEATTAVSPRSSPIGILTMRPAAAPPKSITPNSRPYKGMRDRRLRPILQSFLFSMGFHLRASQDSLGRSKARPHIGAMCWGDGACAVRGLSCRDVPGEIRAGTSGGALLG